MSDGSRLNNIVQQQTRLLRGRDLRWKGEGRKMHTFSFHVPQGLSVREHLLQAAQKRVMVQEKYILLREFKGRKASSNTSQLSAIFGFTCAFSVFPINQAANRLKWRTIAMIPPICQGGHPSEWRVQQQRRKKNPRKRSKDATNCRYQPITDTGCINYDPHTPSSWVLAWLDAWHERHERRSIALAAPLAPPMHLPCHNHPVSVKMVRVRPFELPPSFAKVGRTDAQTGLLARCIECRSCRMPWKTRSRIDSPPWAV